MRPAYSQPFCISTHAPHAGSDRGTATRASANTLFQPTLPMRGATDLMHRPLWCSKFQPTLPMRGATVFDCDCSGGKRISTHAPHAGSDVKVIPGEDGNITISTHAPHAGSDLEEFKWTVDQYVFQPTLPMRGATADINKSASSILFI